MDNDKSEPRYIHPWHHCHHCGDAPITGRRHHCRTCIDGPDNDLCESCFQAYTEGRIQHPAPNRPLPQTTTDEHCFDVFEGQPEERCQHWLEGEIPETPEPAITHPFVCRLVIEADTETVIIGYASLIRPHPGEPSVLITALHVLDPLLKHFNINADISNHAYTGRELPEVIQSIHFYDVFALHWMMAPLGQANRMLILPDARTGGEEPWSERDIAAFSLTARHFGEEALLTDAPPAKGEPVWLLTRSDTHHTPRLFKAVVVESAEKTLVYRFAPGFQPPKYCSGAPLMTASGRIAGVAIGAGELNGHYIGHANHSDNIRKHLYNALH